MVSLSLVPTMSATTSAMSRLSPSESAAATSPSNQSAASGAAAATQPTKVTRKRSREIPSADKSSDAIPVHKSEPASGAVASSASNRKVTSAVPSSKAASAATIAASALTRDNGASKAKSKHAAEVNSDASDEEYDSVHEEEEEEEVDEDAAAIPAQTLKSRSTPVSSLSAIHCGVVNAAGERIYRRKCPFFASLVSLGGREFTVQQPMVNVYTAESDSHRRTLYCCGDLAKRFEATNDAKRMNKVGMWMSRRKNVDGVFQATAIVHKEQGPDSRAGLKTSGYFFTLEIAKQYQQHVITGRKRLEEAFQSGQAAAAAMHSEVEETGSRLSMDQSDAAEAMVDIPARVAQRTANSANSANSASSASSSDESSANEEAPVETVARPVRAAIANGPAADLMSAAAALAEAASGSPNKKQKTVEYAKAAQAVLVKEVKSEFAHAPVKESAFAAYPVKKPVMNKETVLSGISYATPAIATTTATFMPQYGMHPTTHALATESAFTSYHPQMAKPVYPQQHPGYINQPSYQLPLPAVPPYLPSYQYGNSVYSSTAPQQSSIASSYPMPSYSHNMQTTQYYSPAIPAQPTHAAQPHQPHQYVTHMHTVMTSNQALMPNSQPVLSHNGPSAFAPTNPHPYYASHPR